MNSLNLLIHIKYLITNRKTINLLTISCFLLAILMTLAFEVVAQNTVPQDIQYKKRPTEAIARIAQGNQDEVIQEMEDFLSSFPTDAESLYCLAVAYSSKNKVPQAMTYVKRALESSLPLERFIAGPNNLLNKLWMGIH